MESKKLYIGKTIKRLREESHLTQTQLAKMSGVAYSTITKLETGLIMNPGFFQIVNISRALEVSLDKLLLLIIEDTNESK